MAFAGMLVGFRGFAELQALLFVAVLETRPFATREFWEKDSSLTCGVFGVGASRTRAKRSS